MPIAGERHPQSKPVLDVVAIEAVDRQSVLGTTGPPYHYFAKTGLNIRAGHRITLRIADQGSNRVAMGWGTNGIRWAKEFIVPACTSPADHSPWLIYPGGFVIDTVACISLDVISGNHTSGLKSLSENPAPEAIARTPPDPVASMVGDQVKPSGASLQL